MSEILTVFFPQTIKNSNKFLQIIDIKGEKKKIRDGILIQTSKKIDYILFRKKMVIYFMDEGMDEVIKILNSIIKSQAGIGIKVYNKEKRKQIVKLLSYEEYNLL